MESKGIISIPDGIDEENLMDDESPRYDESNEKHIHISFIQNTIETVNGGMCSNQKESRP